MAAKLGRIVTYLEGLLAKSYLIIWSCEITRKTKVILSPLLVATSVDVAGHQTWQGGKLHWEGPTHNFTQPFGHVFLPRPPDKLKQLYLYYQNAFGHQIRQGGGLPWGAPTHEVSWTFNHMVLRDHAKNSIYISTNNSYCHQTW